MEPATLADRTTVDRQRSAPPRLAEGLDERLLLGRFRRRLLGRATGSVLDIACGQGPNFRHYPAHCRITAIDRDPAKIAIARQTAATLNRDIETRTMDAAHLDFPDDCFDTVVSSLALCSFADPVAALREVGRVCKPAGTILLLEPGRSSFPALAAWQDYRERRRGPHTGCHQNRNPLDLVTRAGLLPCLSDRTFFGVVYTIVARPADDGSRLEQER